MRGHGYPARSTDLPPLSQTRMRFPTRLQPWLRLPAYAVNGIEVAVGLGVIQLAAFLTVGPHVAPLIVSGAICASIADLPNSAARTWYRVSAAALLAACAALVVDVLRAYPIALGIAVAVIGLLAAMTLAWGPRAGAVSFAPVLSMIFSMAVPPSGHPFEAAAFSACGGIAYVAWSMFAGLLLQRRYRTLVLAQTLRAAAELFASRASVLVAKRPDAGDPKPMRTWISGEATLADRLQAARDLLFPAEGSTSWQRDVAIVLRVVDLRDVLLASRLDADVLGTDAVAQEILMHVATALRGIGYELDAAADHVRDGTVPAAGELVSIDYDAFFAEIGICADDPRARLYPSLIGRLRQLALDTARVHRLLQGRVETLPLTREQLQLFVAPEGWPLLALRPHGKTDSPVLRHAIRMGLAVGTAYFFALALPWGSHPYWLVLSVAVVLRGNLGETLARRNARVFGTTLGCLVVVGLSHLPSTVSLSLLFLIAAGIAHAFVLQRYWLTATAASVMALLQSHLVDPASGFAIGERVADTFLGAFLAWSFSYVLPSWERRSRPEAIARVLRDLRDYAALSLQIEATDPVQERLARRKAYDALAALAAALHRSRVEPKGVRLPVKRISSLIDHGERLMAHLSIVRLTLARVKNAGAPPPQVDAMLHQTSSALAASLDMKQAAVASVEPIDAAELDALPELPAAHDMMPWLSRRLALMVREATLIRAAAQSGLAA